MKIVRENSLPQINSFSFLGAFKETQQLSQEYQGIRNYKLSKYNKLQKYDSDIVIYNMASDSIVIFDDKEVMGLFSEKISNLKVSDDVFRCLVDQGIIIPDNLDEDLRLSIVRQNQITNPDKELKIAINTTYGCNARCDYCFECNADHSKMSYETADIVADYICKAIDEDTLVTYRWFGGEPLLACDIIDRIINRVNEYFSYKVKYRSVILSNGTVYDEEILHKMYNKWHAYEFHVTLDGEKDIHNKKKNFVKKDFDGYTRVIGLIKNLLENDIIVACRINIDKNNIDSLSSILRAFENYDRKDLLNIYAAPVRRHTKESESYCFDYSEYNEVFDNIFGVLYEHGLLADIDFFAPKRKVTCCSTRATNEIVVDTKGNLYKCMQTATSDQYAVGTCRNGLEYNSELAKWLIPQTPEECKECIYMPICQAGCKGFRSLNNPLVSPCVNEKYYIDTILKYIYIISEDKK